MVGWLIAIGVLLLLMTPLLLRVRVEVSYFGGELKAAVKHMFFTYFQYPFVEKPKKPKRVKKGIFGRKPKGKRGKKAGAPEPLKSAEAPSQTSIAEESGAPEPESVSEPVEEGAEGVADAVPGGKLLGAAIGKEAKETLDLDKKAELTQKLELLKMILKASGRGVKRILRGIRFVDLDLAIVCRSSDDAAAAAINYGKISGAVYNGLSLLRVFFTVSVKNLEVHCDFTPGKSTVDVGFAVDFRPITVLAAGIGVLVRFFFLNRRSKKEALKAQEGAD